MHRHGPMRADARWPHSGVRKHGTCTMPASAGAAGRCSGSVAECPSGVESTVGRRGTHGTKFRLRLQWSGRIARSRWSAPGIRDIETEFINGRSGQQQSRTINRFIKHAVTGHPNRRACKPIEWQRHHECQCHVLDVRPSHAAGAAIRVRNGRRLPPDSNIGALHTQCRRGGRRMVPYHQTH